MTRRQVQFIINSLLCWLFATVPLHAAEPVSTAWLVNPATAQPASLARIRPEIHSVNVAEKYVEIRSAGISLYDLGALQTPNDHVERIRQLRYRFPRQPQRATSSVSGRPDVWGAFVNGVPIYSLFDNASYQEQNLWHFDPLVQRDATHTINLGMLPNLIADGTRHAPLLGYAFDGFPIYGPWGYGAAGELRRMRSGYRLRRIARRDALADGTKLTPAQYGPPINTEYPLGTFAEDYEYDPCLGDLDEYNGRFAVTPEYPQGTYAYFLSTDAQGRLAFPYLLTGRYAGRATEEELREAFRDEAAPHEETGQQRIHSAQKDNASLTIYGKQLAAHQPVRLSFTINAANGQRVRHLENVHERPLHLLVVSEDLEDFAHIHPALAAGNRYEVTHTFARDVRYRLYADYTPPGSAQRITSFVLDVGGTGRVSDLRLGKASFGNTSLTANAPVAHSQLTVVTLTPAQPLRANAEIEFALTLRDAQTQQPPADLEPFLGAWAHFVIIDEKHESFIHAHPLEAVSNNAAHTHDAAALGPPPATIRTLASFPRAGRYKLWAQFQRNGEIITQPFILNVAAAAPALAQQAQTIPPDAIRLNASASGFAPAQLTVPSGKPFKLAITRDQKPNCANKIMFPSLGLSFALPLGETTVIELPALPSGELSFSCGMGMYKGVLLAD